MNAKKFYLAILLSFITIWASQFLILSFLHGNNFITDVVLFIYPSDHKHPEGKLRLNCELNPLAMVAEQAGGMATDGDNRILDIVPRALHQRSPAVIGSRREVLLYKNFVTKT